MTSNNILLISVPVTRSFKKELPDIVSMPPQGLLYLAAHARKQGYKVTIIDFAVHFYSKSEFEKIVKKIKPGVIGISTFTESWSATKLLARYIKDIFPDIYLVAGGNCATFAYEELLKETDIDFVIIGEAEYNFVDLCNALLRKSKKIDNVKGLVYLENNEIRYKENNKRIKDLDSLEWPSRDLVDLPKYAYPITLTTARGCPGNCMFCSSRSFWGKEIYMRSPENILEELMFIEYKFNYNMFFIIDDTFTINTKRAIYFSKILRETKKRFVWGCESRADVASCELLENLYLAGCRKIQFGMESGNNTILKKIGKYVTVEQIENAVKIASNIGFDINISFIIGHAFDTQETIRESLDLALHLKKEYKANPFCSVNTPYPGTVIYDHSEEYGIEILSSNLDKYTMDNPIINTKNVKASELRRYLQLFSKALISGSNKIGWNHL